MKLDLKSVLGVGPPIDVAASPVTPTTNRSAPSPASAAEPDGPARPVRPVRSVERPKSGAGSNAKPNARKRVAVNVPGELLDFARLHAAHEGDYLTDVVLEALARHGSGVVQRAKDRVAARARPPRRSARQRGVKHPTLLVLYLSGAERRELDDAATNAVMTRSAFVAELLTLAGAEQARTD